jgi:hypothetical protein
MFRHCLERLRFLDECAYFGWHPSDHWASLYLELASVNEDREGGALAAAPLGDAPNSMIERRAEILDRFTQTKRPIVGRSFPLDCAACVFDLLSRSELTLRRESVSARVLEGPGFPTDRLDLFFAPDELPFGACQAHGLTSP